MLLINGLPVIGYKLKMTFTLQHKDKYSSARAGLMETGHGPVETPIFMPVGTLGSVKAVHHRELLNDIKAQIILGNTYHLFLRPGLDVISNSGGLHNFINWHRPILTDSGGYQIFSLAENRKLKEDGAHFSSHIDGSKHVFTPENTVDIQRIIGADIIMAFDECTPFPCDYKYAKKSVELTHKWLERGIARYKNTQPHYNHQQAFFPIVQGSTYKELRILSAEKVAECNMDGNAIGGLSVGEPADHMYEMVEIVNNILPAEKPRYLMGVGTPANILEAIGLGVDMFDCVMPTRNGRNGMLFTKNGIMNMRNEKWKNDFSFLEDDSDCFVDKTYSKAYLRHLLISKEILGAQIATIHNLHFYLWLVREARKQIFNDTFANWKNEMIKRTTNRL
jgi:queuine tRNA-ribosyltransferase